MAVATTAGAKNNKQQGKLSRFIAESYTPLECTTTPLEKSVQ